jgi:hypothetical protein
LAERLPTATTGLAGGGVEIRFATGHRPAGERRSAEYTVIQRLLICFSAILLYFFCFAVLPLFRGYRTFGHLIAAPTLPPVLFPTTGPSVSAMAPIKKTKQTLLDLGTFVPDPSKSLLKKHKKLEKQFSGTGPRRTTAFVDKKKQKRIAEAEAVRVGSEKWREFLVESGVEDVDRFRTDILFLSNGRNGPLAFHADCELEDSSDGGDSSPNDRLDKELEDNLVPLFVNQPEGRSVP